MHAENTMDLKQPPDAFLYKNQGAFEDTVGLFPFYIWVYKLTRDEISFEARLVDNYSSATDRKVL